ncbi:MAG: hypothetical protein ABL949_08760 [Fimbriimonadaceae bacterium]
MELLGEDGLVYRVEFEDIELIVYEKRDAITIDQNVLSIQLICGLVIVVNEDMKCFRPFLYWMDEHTDQVNERFVPIENNYPVDAPAIVYDRRT